MSFNRLRKWVAGSVSLAKKANMFVFCYSSLYIKHKLIRLRKSKYGPFGHKIAAILWSVSKLLVCALIMRFMNSLKVVSCQDTEH